jgi:hypothetical protein
MKPNDHTVFTPSNPISLTSMFILPPQYTLRSLKWFYTSVLLTRLKRCTLESTPIPKAFFTPHHLDRCCTTAIQGQCSALGQFFHQFNARRHFCFNVILGPIVAQQWVPTMGVASCGQTEGRTDMSSQKGVLRLHLCVKYN